MYRVNPKHHHYYVLLLLQRAARTRLRLKSAKVFAPEVSLLIIGLTPLSIYIQYIYIYILRCGSG